MKKVFSIIGIVLVGIIAVTAMVSVFLTKDYNFNLQAPTSIKIWKQNTNGQDNVEIGTDEYNEILKLFNSGFKVTVLDAFFQGKLAGKVTVTENSYESLTSSSLLQTNKIFIEFKYSEDQTTNIYGQDITLSPNEETYRSIVIEVLNSTALTQFSAYIRYGDNQDYGYVNYMTYAKHSDLYQYINDNFTI